MRHAIGLLFAAVLLASCSKPSEPAIERVGGAVCHPVFQAGNTPLNAGTAFVLEDGSQRLLVTAIHLFGPSGGLEHSITWDRMPAEVGSVTCEPLRGGTAIH